jgi:DNA-binding transcriptional MerR regulator
LRTGLDSVAAYGVQDGVTRSGELADQAGVHLETLRDYERRGLIEQPPRTPGGYSNYPGAALEVLRFVKRDQQLGFTLSDVEELLHLDAGGPQSCDAARALAATRQADLDRIRRSALTVPTPVGGDAGAVRAGSGAVLL